MFHGENYAWKILLTIFPPVEWLKRIEESTSDEDDLFTREGKKKELIIESISNQGN